MLPNIMGMAVHRLSLLNRCSTMNAAAKSLPRYPGMRIAPEKTSRKQTVFPENGQKKTPTAIEGYEFI